MPNEQWKERELERFRNGEYKRLPFAGQDWFRCYDFGRYPHLSMVDDRPLIAYTQTEAKGIADIQTPMKCGKYLNKYYGPNSENPLFDEKQIASLTEQFMRLFVIPKLLFAKTSEEIVWVYNNGPNSCMSHDANNFDSYPIHPCTVYGYGGPDSLQVAYIKDDERVVARSLVFPKTLSYVRIYGSGSNDDIRLGPALEKAGYTHNPEGLIGAKMKLLYNSNDYIIAPYLDGVQSVKTGLDFLEITNSDCEYILEQTNGLAENDNNYTCEDCDDRVNEDDTTYVNDRYICSTCLGDNYFFCESCDSHNHNNVCINVQGGGSNEEICLHCIENGNYFFCEDCNEWYGTDYYNLAPDQSSGVCNDCAKDYKKTFCGELRYDENPENCSCTKCYQVEGDKLHEQKQERKKTNV